jgi:anti-sigma regulatory factor (Ser/Thr protein kinase)
MKIVNDLLHLPPEPASVPVARHFVIARLRERGCRSPNVETGLAVTELAANAVRHAETPFTVAVKKEDDGTALVEVSDSSDQLPHLREPDDEGGRGLHIVDEVALEWGVRRSGPGKTVFVRLPC